ncbi:MAG: nucleotide pyrophosphohydrolase [Pirellulaceae bacterium]
MNEVSSRSADEQMTIAELKQLVAEFVDQRDWQQFHSPKNLSMALAIEAAELMEHFQWISMEASRDVVANPEKLAEVAEEMSDVLCYLLGLANELNIDISSALESKMSKNREKYPAAVFRGKYGVEDLDNG